MLEEPSGVLWPEMWHKVGIFLEGTWAASASALPGPQDLLPLKGDRIWDSFLILRKFSLPHTEHCPLYPLLLVLPSGATRSKSNSSSILHLKAVITSVLSHLYSRLKLYIIPFIYYFHQTCSNRNSNWYLLHVVSVVGSRNVFPAVWDVIAIYLLSGQDPEDQAVRGSKKYGGNLGPSTWTATTTLAWGCDVSKDKFSCVKPLRIWSLSVTASTTLTNTVKSDTALTKPNMCGHTLAASSRSFRSGRKGQEDGAWRLLAGFRKILWKEIRSGKNWLVFKQGWNREQGIEKV